MVNRVVLSALVAGTLALAASPADADKWSFEIEPYALFVNIEGDASLGRVTGVDVDVDTGDILDNLDLGGMVHFEVHHESSWGLALDYAFMDLKDDLTGPRGGVLDAEVFEGVLEAFVVKGIADRPLELIGGVRWWSIEVDADFDPVILPGTLSRSVDEDWIDGFIGARWRIPLSRKWLLSLRGSLGAGAANFTWQVIPGFRFRVADWMALDLGYRALGVDYETGASGKPGYFMYDVVTHGSILGFAFSF